MSTAEEEWRRVLGFEYYEVSDWGNVRSWLSRNRNAHPPTTPRALKQRLTTTGYPSVSLYSDKKRGPARVHRLVLEAFVGPCPAGMEACHSDGNKINNRLENLRWDSRSGNQADRVQHGTSNRGERQGQSRLTEADIVAIRWWVAEGIPKPWCSSVWGIHPRHVRAIVNRTAWRHVL